MYESDIQSNVTEAIIDGAVDSVVLGVTDNGRCVVVKTSEGSDAAYTADEARELATGIECMSDQYWGSENDTVVEYIRDLAEVVDKTMEAKEFQEKWDDRDVDMELDT